MYMADSSKDRKKTRKKRKKEKKRPGHIPMTRHSAAVCSATRWTPSPLVGPSATNKQTSQYIGGALISREHALAYTLPYILLLIHLLLHLFLLSLFVSSFLLFFFALLCHFLVPFSLIVYFLVFFFSFYLLLSLPLPPPPPLSLSPPPPPPPPPKEEEKENGMLSPRRQLIVPESADWHYRPGSGRWQCCFLYFGFYPYETCRGGGDVPGNQRCI